MSPSGTLSVTDALQQLFAHVIASSGKKISSTTGIGGFYTSAGLDGPALKQAFKGAGGLKKAIETSDLLKYVQPDLQDPLGWVMLRGDPATTAEVLLQGGPRVMTQFIQLLYAAEPTAREAISAVGSAKKWLQSLAAFEVYQPHPKQPLEWSVRLRAPSAARTQPTRPSATGGEFSAAGADGDGGADGGDGAYAGTGGKGGKGIASSGGTYRVLLDKPDASSRLGITLVSGGKAKGDAPVITVVAPGSIAASSNMLNPGQKLFAVNGQHVGDHEAAARALRSSAGTIELIISRPTDGSAKSNAGGGNATRLQPARPQAAGGENRGGGDEPFDGVVSYLHPRHQFAVVDQNIEMPAPLPSGLKLGWRVWGTKAAGKAKAKYAWRATKVDGAEDPKCVSSGPVLQTDRAPPGATPPLLTPLPVRTADMEEQELVARTVRLQEAEAVTRRQEEAAREQAKRAQLAADDQAWHEQAARPPQQEAAESRRDGLHRPFFDKAMKTKDFAFKGPRAAQDAERFAEAMETYSDDDLPWRLVRRDEYGMKRMLDAAQSSSVNGCMAMVRALADPKWKEGKFEVALGQCVRELYAMYGFIERITHAVEQRHIQGAADLKALSNFGIAIAFATPPAKLREQEHDVGGALSELAEVLVGALASRPALSAIARRLKELLARELMTADRIHDTQAAVAAVADRRHAAEINQLPGGRHSNDHVDFRDISVVPSVDELLAVERPFLPRVDRQEAFLADDPQTQFIDRQFRLLREDMIATVREAHTKGSSFSIQLPVRINRLEVHAFKTHNRDKRVSEGEQIETRFGRGPVGLKFVIEASKDGKAAPRGNALVEALQRRRQLQIGSLALLRDDKRALAIGRVVRSLREANELNPDSNREIGIAFEDSYLLSLISLPGNRVLQLIALPGSFFAFEPVLLCLQQMQELPFREELLLEDVDPQAPRYAGAQDIMPQLGKRHMPQLVRNTDRLLSDLTASALVAHRSSAQCARHHPRSSAAGSIRACNLSPYSEHRRPAGYGQEFRRRSARASDSHCDRPKASRRVLHKPRARSVPVPLAGHG